MKFANAVKSSPFYPFLNRAFRPTFNRYRRSRIRSKVGKTKLWFVNIPRTSSSFVQVNLGECLGYPYGKHVQTGNVTLSGNYTRAMGTHPPAAFVKKYLGPDLWNSLETFTIVREPVSWSVSMWRFKCVYKKWDMTYGAYIEWMRKNMETDFFQRKPEVGYFFQSDYIFDPDNGELMVKRVFNFDQRDEISDYLRSRLQVELPIAERVLPTDSLSYSLSKDDLALAHKFFEKDIELLRPFL